MARAAIFGCAGPVLAPAERRFFAAAEPWGFILFARNVADPAQLRRLTAELRASVGRDAPVLVDQEGGRVARLRGARLARMGAGARRMRAPPGPRPRAPAPCTCATG